MSEHTSPSPEPATPADKPTTPEPAPTADKKKQDDPVLLEDYAHPTTQQMRSVGRRRADAEAKLEQQQRDARGKSPE